MIEMNEDTDYVHTHVVNYEPTYDVLNDVCQRWMVDHTNGIAEYRDELQKAVELHAHAMGLNSVDLTDDVDYAVMITWEVENG